MVMATGTITSKPANIHLRKDDSIKRFLKMVQQGSWHKLLQAPNWRSWVQYCWYWGYL